MNPELLLAHFDRISDAPAAVPRAASCVQVGGTREVVERQNDKPVFRIFPSMHRIWRKLAESKEQAQTARPLASSQRKHIVLGSQSLGLASIADRCVVGCMTPSKNRSDFWNGDINWFSPKDIKSDELVESRIENNLRWRYSDRVAGFTRQAVSSWWLGADILKRNVSRRNRKRINATANQDLKVLSPFIVGLERYLQIMFRGMMEFILSDLVKTGTTVQSLKYEEFSISRFPCLRRLSSLHRGEGERIDVIMRSTGRGTK